MSEYNPLDHLEMDCPICESINPVELWLENGKVVKSHYYCESCGWTENSNDGVNYYPSVTCHSVGEFFRHLIVWVQSWRNIRRLLREDEDFEPKG